MWSLLRHLTDFKPGQRLGKKLDSCMVGRGGKSNTASLQTRVSLPHWAFFQAM